MLCNIYNSYKAMEGKTMIRTIWILMTATCTLHKVNAVAPVCSPATYSATLGTNTTANTVLATLTCTDATAGHVITYTVDTSADGWEYFSMTSNQLILANRLDVEFGQITWTIKVFAVDNDGTPNTGTATISLTTYQSTTTTTTTPAPPGYSWFESQDNIILFGSFAGFIALLAGTCVLCCFRYNRAGTCLPKSCPEYRECRRAASRNTDCCPLPCDLGLHDEYEEDTEPVYIGGDTEKSQFGDSYSQKSSEFTEEKETVKTPVKKKKPKLTKKESTIQEEPEETDRDLVVSPVVIGNVNLADVGFDGMRSPGFNAPMFTSYGGKNQRKQPKKQKRY